MSSSRGYLAYHASDGSIYSLDDAMMAEIQNEIKYISKSIALIDGEKDVYIALLSRIKKAMGEPEYWNETNIKNFCNNRLKYVGIFHIGKLIEYTTNIQDVVLYDKIKGNVKYLVNSAFKSQSKLKRSFNFVLGDMIPYQEEFSRKYSGGYLIIRRHGKSEFSVAVMEVGFAYYGDILRYRTTRLQRSDRVDHRIVEGIMYRSDELVYTVGQLKNKTHVRMAILKQWYGLDLYGIRLGIMPHEDEPFAMKIYCLRLLGYESTKVLQIIDNYTGIFSESEIYENMKSLQDGDFLQRKIIPDEIFDLIENPAGEPFVIKRP